MSGYNVALFIHILAVLALFSGAAVMVAAMGSSRRARSVESLREWSRLGAMGNRLMPAFAILILAAAIYMVSDRWGWKTPWVGPALLALIVAFAVGSALIDPRLQKLVKAANDAPAGAVTTDLQLLANDPTLWLGAQLLTSLMVGIVVLMVFKPNGVVSAIVLIVAVILGVASTFPARARYRAVQAEALPSRGVGRRP